MVKNIHIEGEISSNWGEIVSDLSAANDAIIYVNSGGGSVTEGFAMADAIRRHAQNNKVEIIGTGIVASIATMILLAASKGNRKMTANSFFMIHNPSVHLAGEASNLRQMADTLDAMKVRLSENYLAAIKSNDKLINESEEDTRTQIAKWMDSEKWFSASEALQVGLIDEVIEAADYAIASVKNNLTSYKNTPKEIMAKIDITTEEKTMFQKFLSFLGFAAKEETAAVETNLQTIETVENMTDEEMIAILKDKGYDIEKEIEMTEEEMLAHLATNGKKMTKESPIVEVVAETAEAKLTAQVKAQNEEIARLKLQNKAPKATVTVGVEVQAENLTKKERALNRLVKNDEAKFSAIANSISDKMNGK